MEMLLINNIIYHFSGPLVSGPNDGSASKPPIPYYVDFFRRNKKGDLNFCSFYDCILVLILDSYENSRCCEVYCEAVNLVTLDVPCWSNFLLYFHLACCSYSLHPLFPPPPILKLIYFMLV